MTKREQLLLQRAYDCLLKASTLPGVGLEAFQRAAQRNTRISTSVGYALHNIMLGDFEEADAELQAAEELLPSAGT